jgi:hypothetical protein
MRALIFYLPARAGASRGHAPTPKPTFLCRERRESFPYCCCSPAPKAHHGLHPNPRKVPFQAMAGSYMVGNPRVPALFRQSNEITAARSSRALSRTLPGSTQSIPTSFFFRIAGDRDGPRAITSGIWWPRRLRTSVPSVWWGFRRDEVDDVIAGLTYLKSQPFVDPARVAISGCSLWWHSNPSHR